MHAQVATLCCCTCKRCCVAHPPDLIAKTSESRCEQPSMSSTIIRTAVSLRIQLYHVSKSAVLQVSRLGVSVVLVEDGVSAALLAEGLAAFEAGAAAVR